MSVSSTKWPNIKHQLAFYKAFIQDRQFVHQFNETYEPILDMLQESSNINKGGDMDKITRALKDTHLIEDNFLKLHVKWSQHTYSIFVDEPKFSVTGILANLGAILNLYAGITLVLVFEIVELIYDIGYSVYHRKEERRKKHQAIHEVSPLQPCNNS